MHLLALVLGCSSRLGLTPTHLGNVPLLFTVMARLVLEPALRCFLSSNSTAVARIGLGGSRFSVTSSPWGDCLHRLALEGSLHLRVMLVCCLYALRQFHGTFVGEFLFG